MQNKKLASIIALTAVVANLGVASMAFAQTNVTGTQPIDCSSEVTDFSTRVNPEDFSFPSASVSNNYDNFTTNAYFGALIDNDLSDVVAVTSNTPVACASESKSVSLSVQAETPFYDAAHTRYLENVGADNTFETADDIGAILSISHDAVTCNEVGVCDSANAVTAYGAAKDGSVNWFDATANDGTTQAGYDGDLALLQPTDNFDKFVTNTTDPTPIQLFSSPQGFDGEVAVQNITYQIALPANIEIGSLNGVEYTTNVMYTIAN